MMALKPVHVQKAFSFIREHGILPNKPSTKWDIIDPKTGDRFPPKAVLRVAKELANDTSFSGGGGWPTNNVLRKLGFEIVRVEFSMPVDAESEVNRILDRLRRSKNKTFTTYDFIQRFKAEAPKVWESIVKEHGAGGKGAGRHYSAFSRISQYLHRVALRGSLTKLPYIKAPEEWGSAVIRLWSFDPSEGLNIFPEDQEQEEEYFEGAVTTVTVNKFERNPKARRDCINHYGAKCSACEIDFGERYGELGKGFIHVHHLKPLKNIRKTYKVDPIKDLRPVCPNCHAMIHCREEMQTIEQIKKLIQRRSK
jgi:predicted HNH restriction endonuclease